MLIYKRAKSLLIYICVLALFIWSIAPLGWMVISAMTPGSEMLSSEQILPQRLTLDRFRILFTSQEVEGVNENAARQSAVFRRSLVNSLIVSGSTTLLSLFLGSMAAYAFARLRFRFRKALRLSIMFFQLLPPIALLIPYYVAASQLRIVDRLSTLILVNTSFVLAYVVWVMMGFFASIPRDLENAARIDGCGYLGAYFRIIVPTVLPGLVAVGALAFLMSWDEFLYALVFTQSDGTKTVSVAVSEFGTKYGVDYGMLMTAGAVATLAPFALALFFQKYIVTGLTSGAVKE